MRLLRRAKNLTIGIVCTVSCLSIFAPQTAFALSKLRQKQLPPTLRGKQIIVGEDPTVFDLAPETDSKPILAAASQLEAEPNASAVLLLDEGHTVVYPNFVILSRYHTIIKILDQSAARQYAEFSLSHPTSTSEATVESAHVVKTSGAVQDFTSQASHDFAFFPLLSPGDLLDISYQVKDSYQGSLSHQFWSAWSFNQTNVLTRLSRYVLITPQELKFTAQKHGPVPDASVYDRGAWRIHEWRMTNLPVQSSEIMGIPETDSGIWLDISTISSWSRIVDWYEKLSASRYVPDSEVRAKAIELTQNAKTDTEKIHAIQKYVADDIQYQSISFRLSGFVPMAGKDVIRSRLGDAKDKAALMMALLAAVGIKSNMVLLSDRIYGLVPYLPSPRFGHAIVRVETTQGPLFVDSAADLFDFGGLPSGDQQVLALVIAPTTTELIDTPTLSADNTLDQKNYTGTLDADGSLRGTCDWTLTGQQAWNTRLDMRGIPENHRKEMLYGLANYLIKGAVCGSASVEHSDEPDFPLTFHFAFQVDRYGNPADNLLLMPLPWAGEAKDAFVTALQAEPKRTQDLEMAASRIHIHSTAQIHLPSGYLPQVLPPEVHQASPFGSFRIQYQVTSDQNADELLTATRDVTLTALRVPAQEVPKYAAFLQAMNTELNRQIVLKKL